MSLISFHRLLISAGIGFCVVFAGWEVRQWLSDRGVGPLVLAVSFALLGVGLYLYLRRLNRILGYDRDPG
jgi:hydrogenase-4 membrane subunit HyfE